MASNDTTIRLSKASGMTLRFSDPDDHGYYLPQDLDRSALQQHADGSWTERQPDGFELRYGYPASSSSSASSSSGSSSSGTSTRTPPMALE